MVIRWSVYHACTWLVLFLLIWRWYLYISRVLVRSSISSLVPRNQLLNWLRLSGFVVHMVVSKEKVYFWLTILALLIVLVLVLYMDFSIFVHAQQAICVRDRSFSRLLPWCFRGSSDGSPTWAIDFGRQVLLHVFGQGRRYLFKILILRCCSLNTFLKSSLGEKACSIIEGLRPLNTAVADVAWRHRLIARSLVGCTTSLSLRYGWRGQSFS